VLGSGKSTFAQYARACEDHLVAKPTNLTFEQAAAVGVSGSTALRAVRDRGRVEPGQRLLVIGASGGVGTFAVQLAKTFHTRDDATAGRQRYDVILDIGGNRSLTDLRRALTPKGTLVIVGGETDGRWLGGTHRQLQALVLSAFVGQRLGTFIASTNDADLTVLTQLIEAGRLTPAIDRTYPLSRAPEAIRYLEAGHVRGKVVITV
jgi:NADPH:quinone reductase-like Zn-dependent oxidoreductase